MEVERRSLIAEKALKILEIPSYDDPVGMLRKVSSPSVERADIKYAVRILKLIDEGNYDEAERKLEVLEAWHRQCVGG